MADHLAESGEPTASLTTSAMNTRWSDFESRTDASADGNDSGPGGLNLQGKAAAWIACTSALRAETDSASATIARLTMIVILHQDQNYCARTCNRIEQAWLGWSGANSEDAPFPSALVPARWPWGEGPVPRRPERRDKARWGKWDAMNIISVAQPIGPSPPAWRLLERNQ
jgi:hypothetical protein